MENQINNAKLPEEPASNEIHTKPEAVGSGATYGPYSGPYSKHMVPARKKPSKAMWIAISIAGVVLIGLGILGKQIFTEIFASDHIDVLTIEGTIGPSADGGFFSNDSGYNHDFLMDMVDELMEDDKNKAILLNINTPGGAVYQTDELYLKLLEYKQTTNRPVYASFGQIACSGGYYLAMASDKIYCNRNSITGSIGVISGPFMDFSQLVDKLGIKVVDITSGRNKNMGSQFVKMTDEQKQIFQSYVDEAYTQFVEIVDQGRPGLTLDQVKVLADGRIYSAKQALDHQLVDQIGTLDDTIAALQEDYLLGECEVIYREADKESSFFDYLFASANKLTPKSDAQILEEYFGKTSFGYICPQFVK